MNLPSLLDKVVEVFSKYKLGVIQKLRVVDPSAAPTNNLIVTQVIDLSNEEVLEPIIESVFVLPNIPEGVAQLRDANQRIGGGITYFRRYSIYTLLNIHPDVDDDCVGQSQSPSNGKAYSQPMKKYSATKKTEAGPPPKNEYFKRGI